MVSDIYPRVNRKSITPIRSMSIKVVNQIWLNNQSLKQICAKQSLRVTWTLG